MTKLIQVGSVESTMSTAISLFESGNLRPGQAVVAGFQSAGQGRLDRTWLAEPGQAVLMTAYQPVQVALESLGLLAIATGVAVAETLDHFGVRAELKWPNDLLLNDRKLGGILIRTRIEKKRVHVFAGVGINVLSIPEALDNSATSISDWSMSVGTIEEIALATLNKWNDVLRKGISNSESDVVDRWTARAAWMNCPITVVANKLIEGIMIGLDESGRLLIKTQNVIRAIDHGDVIRGPRRISQTSYTDPGN